MESLAQILEPHKDLVAKSAQLLMLAQMMSPLLVLNDMRKTKSTNGMPIVIFLLGIVFTSLGTRFSQLIKDDASLNANLIGLALSVIYLTTYFYYVSPSEKLAELKKLFAAVTFISIIILYSKFEDPDKIEHRFGMIFSALFFGFMVFPILDSIKAYKEKCTKHLPFPMILTGFLVGLSWFLHGIIINSGFVILQNALMVAINIIQLSFFLIYPSEPSKDKKKSKKKRN